MKRSGRWLLCSVWTLAAVANLLGYQTDGRVPVRSIGADAQNDDRYRIGPGDVIDIKVFNRPEFSRDGVKVDQRGTIRILLIKDEIKAACHTEDELAADIKLLLKEYLREPEVIVQIREYLSVPIAALGEVRAPSRFLLQRRIRLLELLTYAGGPTDKAGRTIQIVHTGPLENCETKLGGTSDPDEPVAPQFEYYRLSETLNGDEKANPYLRPGDVVSIPAAEQVYVIGNVVRPSSIPLKEVLTVSRAIAIAGGPAPDTKKSQIHITRQTPGTSEKQDIVIDLDAINQRKAEDLVLMANDIVEVPTSTGKRLLRSLVGAVVPNVASLPTRVIP